MLWSGDYHPQGIDAAMLKGTVAPVGRYRIEAISPLFRKGRRPSPARARPVQFFPRHVIVDVPPNFIAVNITATGGGSAAIYDCDAGPPLPAWEVPVACLVRCEPSKFGHLGRALRLLSKCVLTKAVT